METKDNLEPRLAEERGQPKDLHLVLSTSTSLGILAFFGSVLVYPNDILGSSEGLTTVWVVVFIMIGVNAGFFANAFLKRTWGHLLVLAGDICCVVTTSFVASELFYYTADNHEPFLVQLAWFLRDKGLPVGMLLGAATFSSVTSLSYMIARESARAGTDRGKLMIGPASSMFLLIALFASYQFLYRYSNMTTVLVLMFLSVAAATAASARPAIALLSKGEAGDAIPPGSTSYYPRTRSFSPPNVFDPMKTFHDRIELAGNERISFWWTFCLLFFADAGMAYLVIDAYPANNGTYLVFLVYLFLILFAIAAYTYSRRRSDTLLLDKGIKRWKTSGLAFVDAFRVIGTCVSCCGIAYFFRSPYFIPDILGKVAAVGVVGCLVAAVSKRSRAWNQVLSILCLGIVALNYYLLFTDALSNAYNVYGPMDTFFPFQYIHSWWHVISAGFCTGFLLTSEFIAFATRHNDGGDSIQRSLIVTVLAIVFPGLAVYVGYGLIGGEIPGGRPEVWEAIDKTLAGNEGLFWTCVAGAGLALISITLQLVKTGHLMGLKYLARLRELAQPPGWHELREKRGAMHRLVTRNRRVVKPVPATAIITLVVVGLIAGGSATFWQAFKNGQQRPLVYYESGKFALWLANSTERFDPDTVVFLEPSSVIEEFRIRAAANEYEAFQIVYTSLGQSMNDLTCEFTTFTHGPFTIPASAFRIRHVEHIIDGKFPDVLRPFTRLQVTGPRNHAFWVSVQVPYGTAPGPYNGTLYFRYNKNVEQSTENTTIPVKFTVDVYNFTVPRMRHLRTNMGEMTDSAAYMESFQRHRINSYGVPVHCTLDHASFVAPGSRYTCYYNTSDYTYTFNWSYWDALTQQNLDAGANGFCFFGSPMQGMPRVPRLSEPGWNESYASFLQQLQQHLIDKNWLKYAFIYFIDEFQMFIPEGFTAEEYYVLVESFLQLINASAPLIKIMTTTPPRSDGLANLRQYIDIYCPIATDYNQTEWEGQKALNKEFWQYYCVGPQAPWPNSHLYNRLFETRVMLWQCFHYNIQGFLYWSSNAQYHGQYGFGYNGWGDGWFVHIGEDGIPYDSPRWENYLDAQEDYEYLWLANRSISWLRANSSAYTAAQLDSFEARLRSVVSSVASDREIHAQHPAVVLQARSTVAELLEQFAPDVDLLSLSEAQWWPVG